MTFMWVKGHNGTIENKESDRLVKKGAEKDIQCHHWYCSALGSRFIALDVRFVVKYCHNCKALRCVVSQGFNTNRTCIKCLRVQPK